MMNRGGERAVDGSDTQCGLTNHLLTRLSDRRAGARAAAEASTRNAGGPNTPLSAINGMPVGAKDHY
jgi:hypothetical protein